MKFVYFSLPRGQLQTGGLTLIPEQVKQLVSFFEHVIHFGLHFEQSEIPESK